MPTHLSIIVYVASPIDYVRYRHTAIYLEYPSTPTTTTHHNNHNHHHHHQTSPPSDLTLQQTSPDQASSSSSTTTTTTATTTTSSLLEIIGGNGFFRFHETPNYTLPLLPTNTPSPTTPANNNTKTPGIPSNTTIPTPSLSTTGVGAEIARIIPLPPIADSVSVSAIRTAIICTPINNSGMDWMDWNYQNWVGDVLGRMVKRGIITEGDREDAIEKMVEGVLEAKDEWMNV